MENLVRELEGCGDELWWVSVSDDDVKLVDGLRREVGFGDLAVAPYLECGSVCFAGDEGLVGRHTEVVRYRK